MKYHLFAKYGFKSMATLTSEADKFYYYNSVDTFEATKALIESMRDTVEFRVIKGVELSFYEEVEEVVHITKIVKNRTLLDD